MHEDNYEYSIIIVIHQFPYKNYYFYIAFVVIY